MDEHIDLNTVDENFKSICAWLFKNLNYLSDTSLKILCTFIKYKYLEISDGALNELSRNELLLFSGCNIDYFNLSLKNLISLGLVIKNSGKTYSLSEISAFQSIETHRLYSIKKEIFLPQFVHYDDRISEVQKKLLLYIKEESVNDLRNYTTLSDENLKSCIELSTYDGSYVSVGNVFINLSVLEKHHYILIIPETHSASGMREIYPLV